MRIGVLTLEIYLPGCGSLKEKRQRIKPLMHRLRREFNLSVAEVEAQDRWQTAVVACVMVSNDARHLQQALQRVLDWVGSYWPEGTVVGEQIQLL